LSRHLVFISHPNVLVNAQLPVPRWPLSPRGRERMQAGLKQPWVQDVSAVYCSTERKAIDGAEILAAHRGLSYTALEALGENDRSATGYLPPDEFEAMADRFFAEPERSVRGWERAVDAQARIVTAVEDLVAQDGSRGTIAIVSHGAVGTLLHCHLAGRPISRQWDQPANGGGNYYRFSHPATVPPAPWQPFDGVTWAA